MNIRIFSTSLDGTLLGQPESTDRFTRTWTSLERGRRPLLVYNTRRSVANTLSLVAARQLPEPDYIIGGIGTELYSAYNSLDSGYGDHLQANWDADTIEHTIASFQHPRPLASEVGHRLKSSWIWEGALDAELKELQHTLRDKGISAVINYSCSYFLDVIPASAGKGAALAWLCERVRAPLRTALVAGDTGTDSSMFKLESVRGIIVKNALPELLDEIRGKPFYFATGSMADGIAEGLHHFSVIP